ncbi:MAG: YbaN family protein [Gammaproteobacteria bacterium]|nr:YbaN family protein [Gammaproteobacteria bacterium]
MLTRPLFFALGWLFFALGFVGVFLPVLPTTPLMLLALWCFSRSSARFHNWLYTHRVFGPPLQQWEQHRVIPRVAKVFAVAFMTASLVYVYGFLVTPTWLKVLMTVTMAYGFWFILSKPSVAPEVVREEE